ncbi:MAG: Holliday junction branch migration DNA helicase RuvB [Candidatus Hatepunaea meridiana]|nr:Holliday junction branch migration DNA helicase RuvB [Candidatus Hatepunaea meridiana]
MNNEERITSPDQLSSDIDVEQSLRPVAWDDFVGQKRVVDNLKVFLTAARNRGEALDHCLFHGPPGLGKTTLAHLISKELGVEVKVTSGPVLERPGDLAGLLTNLTERDVLFIDEIHRLNNVVEEYLYPAMEDFTLDIMIDKGVSARSVQISLPRFTLVGATTRAGLLTSPLRARFGVISRLDYYDAEELFYIIQRSAKLLKVALDEDGAMEVARRSRGTPRIANRLLRRLRDFAEVEGDGRITLPLAKHGLGRLEIDPNGLDDMDMRIIRVIIENFSGGPVGLSTIAVAVAEEAETIEEIYEPYLIQQGFLERTPRGRKVTAKARELFGNSVKKIKQERMF